MPNRDESPKSIEPVISPPPRTWQRTACFAINFALALLPANWCWSGFLIFGSTLQLAASFAILIYAACECAGIFIRSVALERGLGFANIAIALGLSVLAAANIRNLNPPNAGPGNIVFVLVFGLIYVGVVIYLFVCGFQRLKWTGKSSGA